ncbi:Mediator of RNA polymerase II transcription subunit 32 [Quillaja saponaria]|uniref:Mediator of RNA polymerase II transcription subunit 32 n=1 Tax=Quillaja saponaria TaxID=32244 RepID=A0AAD7PTX6_QUISA|nr:Mediator of RNA polymerase II transcription subunit 32 [Quillaja saponaria]
MDKIVDSLESAYNDYIAAAAIVLETKENSGGEKTATTDAALVNFKQKLEQFKVACDQAEEFVESTKQRLLSECLVDEATGSVTDRPGEATSAGVPHINAAQLEQISKTVRSFIVKRQQDSGATGSSSAPSHPKAHFDDKFSKDAAQ